VLVELYSFVNFKLEAKHILNGLKEPLGGVEAVLKLLVNHE
jgi:hypothetical protein